MTLEPCQMCAGAIVQARIPRVVMGSMNPKAGCAGSIINLLEMKAFNHQVEVTRDVLREECSAILQTFFSEMREKQRRNALRHPDPKSPGRPSGLHDRGRLRRKMLRISRSLWPETKNISVW